MDKKTEQHPNYENKNNSLPGVTADLEDLQDYDKVTASEIKARTCMQNNSRGNDFSSTDKDAQ